MSLHKNFNGFTLFELLVVIMIIGVLATMTTVMFKATMPKTRDAKRISDIKKIQTALEMYYADEGTYPTDAEVKQGSPLKNPVTQTEYMHEIPKNALPVDGECDPAKNTEFKYTQTENGNNYEITYCLGSNVGWVPSGQNSANNTSVSIPVICGLPIEYLGQSYNTTNVNGKCVIKENLNVGTMISLSAMPTNDGVIEKWCLHNNQSSCETYGAYYTWAEALGLPPSCNTSNSGVCNISGEQQGICPSGFHIATDNDLYILEKSFSTGSDDSCKPDRNGYGCSPALNDFVNGSFKWMFAGYKPHGAATIQGGPGYLASLMTSDAYQSNAIKYRIAENPGYGVNLNEEITRAGSYKDAGLSVRCIKN